MLLVPDAPALPVLERLEARALPRAHGAVRLRAPLCGADVGLSSDEAARLAAVQLSAPHALRDARARFEREVISAALIRHHGRAGDAAKALGIQRTNLYRKVRQLNVSRALLSNRK